MLRQRWSLPMRLVAIAVIALGVAPATASPTTPASGSPTSRTARPNVSAYVATPPVAGAHHIDLVRSGAVIATLAADSSFYATLDLANLQRGDVARFYDGSTVRASASYDGQPAFSADACARYARASPPRARRRSRRDPRRRLYPRRRLRRR